MSYHVFFSFSTRFSKAQRVPKGTLARILDRIKHTEETLGLKRELTYTPEGEKQRPGWHWRGTQRSMLETAGPEVDRTLSQWHLKDRERDALIECMSQAVLRHNDYVMQLYEDLTKWQGRRWKRGEAETITVPQSVEFWGGLQILEFPRELWTRNHFTEHMQHLHELLTTGESRGVSLDCKPFNPKQASALLKLLEDELDQWNFDMRFDIPLDENLKPYDMIVASYDGGYDWCERCGPIHTDDFRARCAVCPLAKRGKCHLKNDHPAEFED